MITGEITQVGEHRGEDALLIEEDPEVSEPGEQAGKKVWFFIERQTEILVLLKDGTTSPASEEELVPGRVAQGWTTGVILDSDPAQTTAACIVLLQP